MRLKLLNPLVIGTSTIDALNLRDHTIASDYLAFDQRGGVAQRIALIASVAGTDEAIVGRLGGVDYQRAEREIDRLLREDETRANAHNPDGTAKTGDQLLAEANKALEKK